MASLIRLEVGRLEPLLTSGKIDCLIAESEDGFCQLGQERRLLSDELGYVDTSLAKYTIAGYSEKLEPSIGQLCDWNRSENKDVTLNQLNVEQLTHFDNRNQVKWRLK
jgi:hypothetical protein